MSQLDLAYRREACKGLSEGKGLAQSLEAWFLQKRPEVLELMLKFNPDSEIDQCLKSKIDLISITDSKYPHQLAVISDPPLVLYSRGNWAYAHDPAIAIVGSRQASFYGEEQARRFSRVLADAGWAIVSGLALGIDQAAHEAALSGGGKTVAVLGCGINVVYPLENKKLYEKIAEEGLIVSEYPLGAEPRAYHFPRRNRILSGLACGVFVVEAHEKSGSLITAYQALEEGREVFALPGPVHHITSRGTHRLIREGATLVEAPEEIILHFSENPVFFSETKKVFSNLNSQNTESLDALFLGKRAEEILGDEPEIKSEIIAALREQNYDYEGLLESTQMNPQEFAQKLTDLEIEGAVRKNSNGYYELT